MFDIELIGIEDVIKNLNAAEKSLQQAKIPKMREAISYVKSFIRKKELSGQVLHKRTGLLQKSIKGAIVKVGNLDIIGKVYAATGGKYPPHPKIHEIGAVIKPKRGKFLKIPLDPVLQTFDGKKLYPKKDELFVLKTSSGKLMLFRKDTKEPVFNLVPSVRIPARPYMAPAVEKTKKKVYEILGEIVAIAVRRGNGS